MVKSNSRETARPAPACLLPSRHLLPARAGRNDLNHPCASATIRTLASLREPAQAQRNSRQAPACLPPSGCLPLVGSQHGQGETSRPILHACSHWDFYFPRVTSTGKECKIYSVHPQATTGEALWAASMGQENQTCPCASATIRGVPV